MTNGDDHGEAACGSANRFWPIGFCANGTPKNWVTVTEAVGSNEVVPMMTPESSVAEGAEPAAPAGAAEDNENAAASSARPRNDILQVDDAR